MATQLYSVSEGQRFNGDANLTVVECYSCHVTYAIPTSFYNSMKKWRGDRKDGRGWKCMCPFGHTWWFVGESEEDKLRRQLENERDHAARLAAQRDQAKASARAQKGQATRARNERKRALDRIANGVCPVPGCKRSGFVRVASHIAAKHPDYHLHEEPEAE